PVLVPGVDDESPPLAGQCPGQREAETLRGSGDDGNARRCSLAHDGLLWTRAHKNKLLLVLIAAQDPAPAVTAWPDGGTLHGCGARLGAALVCTEHRSPAGRA